jgi:hypothetical protein
VSHCCNEWTSKTHILLWCLGIVRDIHTIREEKDAQCGADDDKKSEVEWQSRSHTWSMSIARSCLILCPFPILQLHFLCFHKLQLAFLCLVRLCKLQAVLEPQVCLTVDKEGIDVCNARQQGDANSTLKFQSIAFAAVLNGLSVHLTDESTCCLNYLSWMAYSHSNLL